MPLRMLRTLAIVLPIVETTTFAVGESGGQLPAPQATQSVTAAVTFGPRITLQVSSKVLHFDVTDPSAPAMASVDFAVAGRTAKGGEVVLAVEITDSPGPTPYALSILGGFDGVTTGPLVHDAPKVMARWGGGGFRSGRVTFRLDAAPGRYEIPIRFLVKLSERPSF